MNKKLFFARDFMGIFFISFTIFSVIALVSYFPGDPSFNNYSSFTNTPIQNQGGLVGGYLSDLLVQLFGSGSFLFSGITFLVGWILIRYAQFERCPLVLGSGGLILINGCTLLSIYWTQDPFFENRVQPGGMIGTFLGEVLKMWFNDIGSQLMVWTLLIISFIALVGISVNAIINKGLETFIKAIIFLWNYLKLFSTKQEMILGQVKAWLGKKRNILKAKEPLIISIQSEPELVTSTPKKKKVKKEDKDLFAIQETIPLREADGKYQIPPLSLLDDLPLQVDTQQAREEILTSSKTLENKLADFGIEGRVVQVLPGPVITLYEFEPAPGIKVSRILSLTDDLALAMRSASVRILAPVPGKPVVGIEIPNRRREIVSFKEIVSSIEFGEMATKLAMALGKDNIGKPVALDLAQIPHLLIAGATGSGKSVGVNSLICSLLLNATPDEVKMIMIDPKMLELSIYDGIPHLIAPVVIDPKKAASALQWAVVEMEERYKKMADMGVRNITGFNELMERSIENDGSKNKQQSSNTNSPSDFSHNDEKEKQGKYKKLPYIVIIIDELADLMMVSSKGVEDSLTRLAQMARAAGIHLILATQRPSVDVLTGVIKANFPARISYQVTSRVDSRTILDNVGAEKLLGKGDMLFLPPSLSRVVRIHGAMVKDSEINRILQFIRQQEKPEYIEDIFIGTKEDRKISPEEDYDEKYDEAVALVAKAQQASISMVQRKLRIGYNRAARIIEVMEREGVIGPSDGIKQREVYVKDVPMI